MPVVRTPQATLAPIDNTQPEVIEPPVINGVKRDVLRLPVKEEGLLEQAGRFVSENGRTILATGTRVAGPLLGGAVGTLLLGPGPGTAVGAAGGAALVEAPTQYIIEGRDELDLADAGVNVGLASIPIPGAPGLAKNILRQAAAGGGLALAEVTAKRVLHGEGLPTLEEAALATTVGSVVGGTVGAIARPRGGEPVKVSTDGPRMVEVGGVPAVIDGRTGQPVQIAKQIEGPTKPIMAVRLKDGRVVSDPQAVHHADVVERSGVEIDDVTDTGFVINGQYQQGNLTGKSTLPEWARDAAVAEGYDLRAGTPTGAKANELPPIRVQAETLHPGMRQSADDAVRDLVPAASGEGGGPPPDNSVLGTPQYDDDMTRLLRKELKPEVVDAITAGVLSNYSAQELAQTTAGKLRQRLYKQIGDKMVETGVDPRVVKFWNDTVQGSGQRLAFLSHLSQRMRKAAEGNVEAQAVLDALDRESAGLTTTWDRTRSAINERLIRPVIDVWRASLISQFSTGAVNAASQGGASAIKIFETALADVAGGRGLGRTTELGLGFIRSLGRKNTAQLIKVMEQFPDEAFRVGALTLRDDFAQAMTVPRKYGRVISSFNSAQEMFFRRALLDGSLRGRLRDAGLDAVAFMRDPKQYLSTLNAEQTAVVDAAMRAAVDDTLEGTFQVPLKAGTLMGDFSKVMHNHPWLYAAYPFPRYLANSWKFMFDHSPAGLANLLLKSQGKNWLQHGAAARETAAKAVTGTALLGAALTLRNSKYAGDRWYELQGEDGKVNIIRYGPFASYLFMAEMISTMADVGADMIRTDKDLVEATRARWGLSGYDVLQGVFNTSKIEMGDLVFGPYPAEQRARKLRDFAASFIGGFTVPFRTFKDMIAGVDEQEAVARDARAERGEPFLAPVLRPAIANVPGLSQALPPKYDMTRGGASTDQHPAIRQLTGLRITTRTALEKELDRLGMSPFQLVKKTGYVQVDREIERAIGDILRVKNVDKLLASPEYAGVDDAARRYKLTELFRDARRGALEVAKIRALRDNDINVLKALNEMHEQRKPKPVRELLQSRKVEQP